MSKASEDAMRLTRHVLIGLVLGAVLGVVLKQLTPSLPWLHTWITAGVLKLIADVFRNGLSLLVVPLVFFSLASGTASLKDPAQLGRLGGKTLGLYVITTLMAVSLALFAATVLQPGAGVEQATSTFDPPPAPPVLDVLVGMVPKNPVEALAQGNMLQIIVFAILLGIALVMAGKPGERATAQVNDWNDVVLQLVTLIMKLAPLGVFALLARAVAELGMDTIYKLLKYFLLVLGLLLVQLVVVYPLMLKLVGGLNPIPWIRKMSEVWLFAFSTSSSNATLPVNLRVVETRLGADNRVAAFAIPLGATINMNGTSIMQGVATAFIAQLYGIDLTLTQLVMVVGMATLAAIGTAGVPSAGMVMLAGVLTQVGLPVEAIGIILSVDRLLDMVRTVVNVSGDAAVTCIVAKSEGQLDQKIYDGP